MITLLIATLAFQTAADAPAPLVADTPLVVPGGAGHFDFMNVDAANRLVIASHPGKKSVVVVNLTTNEVKDIDAGAACNGIGVDSKGGRVFAAGPGQTLVRFDSKTWTKTGTLALAGPGDCVQFDSKNGVVYVDNDDGTNLWVVDPDTLKIKATVTIKEAPEYMEFDRTRNRIFQAIKSTNSVQVIDASTYQVVSEWTIGEATSPHGLALDRKAGRIYVAGKNGKLAILDADSGKLLNTVDVVKSSDQIAYDSKLKRLYIPGSGTLQVLQVAGDNATVIGGIPVDKDCHRVVVDSRTNDVWVAYTDADNSYVQRFKAAKPASESNGQ
jgi:DNA-binding beta-propeller fold protein YncE